MEKSKEKQIYNSGIKLFGKFGVKRVSIDMIVKDAGVAKGTFYIYFKNKQELYEKIIDDIFDCGKKHISVLYDKTHNVKEKFFNHLVLVLSFFEKNLIIRNIAEGNKDYFSGKINTDYLLSQHVEVMKKLFGEEFNNEELMEISKIKIIFFEIINFKKCFPKKKEYDKFVLKFASIITNGLFSDNESFIKSKAYSQLQKI